MKIRKIVAGKKAILGNRYEELPDCEFPFQNQIKNEARQQIVELLSKSVFNTKQCLCGEALDENSEVLSLVERNYLPVKNIICRKCGIIRIDPLPDNVFYNKVYSELYWKLSHGNIDLTKNRFNFSVKRALPFSNYLKKSCSLTSKTIIEIGASYGAGLFVLKDQGCKCLVGYDYDRDFIKKGIEYSGIDLRHGGIGDAVKDGVKYDIVILRHVLEHFLDPLTELNELKNIISDDGLLFVEVPGVFNLDYWVSDPMMYFDIFHPFSFSLKTLTMIMNMSGYSLYDGNNHIYSLWKMNEGLEKNFKIHADEYSKIKYFLIHSELNRLNKEKFNNSIIGKMSNTFIKYVKAITNKI